ncbi:MAG: hypothetical protein WCT99_09855 [Bacteroidota bacterium]
MNDLRNGKKCTVFPAVLLSVRLKHFKYNFSAETISRPKILSTRLFADAVKRVIRQTLVPPKNIDLTGSHGQTA